MSETEQVQEEKKEEQKNEPEEYTDEVKEIQKDHNEVEKAQDKFIYSAGSRIPKLANILKENELPDGTKLSDEDIRDKLVHDLKGYWTRDTILEAFPDWLKREKADSETEEDEGEEDDTGKGKAKEAAEEDPVKALKSELSEYKKGLTNAQKQLDKEIAKSTKLAEELQEFRNQSKELKENTKLLDIVMDIYDKKLNSLTFPISGMSIKKIEDFAKTSHGISDEVDLTIKITTKGFVIDTIA